MDTWRTMLRDAAEEVAARLADLREGSEERIRTEAELVEDVLDLVAPALPYLASADLAASLGSQAARGGRYVRLSGPGEVSVRDTRRVLVQAGWAVVAEATGGLFFATWGPALGMVDLAEITAKEAVRAGVLRADDLIPHLADLLQRHLGGAAVKRTSQIRQEIRSLRELVAEVGGEG